VLHFVLRVRIWYPFDPLGDFCVSDLGLQLLSVADGDARRWEHEIDAALAADPVANPPISGEFVRACGVPRTR
jgi:hypothetical protein